MLREKEINGLSGWLMLVLLVAALGLSVWMLVEAIAAQSLWILFWVLALVSIGVCFVGLTPVNPNEAKVVQLFGRYTGTLKQQGLRWVNPLSHRRRVSMRVRNFESGKLKVNDHDGNFDRDRGRGGLACRGDGRGGVPGGRFRALRACSE